MLRGVWREAAAELLGTFVLIVFGTGVVAQVVLSRRDLGIPLSIHLAWGLAVTLGIYVSAGVSGAHLNPAVTLALAVLRGFPWRKVPAYVLAQLAGAFAGAAVTFATYREAFDAFDGGLRRVVGEKATAGVFATYPQPFLSVFPGGFVDQVVGTALLMLGIFAIGDRRNAGPATAGPVLVGALVALIGMSFGFNSGYAINPARDLGPRLFTAAAGWGSEVFRAGGGWWWVPVVAPCLGGLLGGCLYDLLVTRYHPPVTA
ncbi:MAG TPA: MIP family channel protein [Vicinamibacteria bacterium]|nr:MIP family channel protein [Vicinamibacteria bacterium]